MKNTHKISISDYSKESINNHINMLLEFLRKKWHNNILSNVRTT